MNKTKTTHFGYEEVSEDTKKQRVSQVFDSVAGRYDVMNDVMSFGIHRLWKWLTIQHCHIKAGQTVLDVAAGTGDLSARLARQVGPAGQVIATDINASMLGQGRHRLINQGIIGNISYIQADAETLPFHDNTFDCITIAFGLRNVTHKEVALSTFHRILKPGGRLMILEFSKTRVPVLSEIYDFYSFNVLPRLGKIITNDSDSYRYLAESIRMHPDQQTLRTMMEEAGFENCDYHNFSTGIVALHHGYKL